MSNNNNVCRFCLKLVHDENVELINETAQKIFGVLLIKLDLDVTEDPLACKVCVGILNEIYMFKSECLYHEDIIGTHFKRNLKINLKDVLRELENKPSIHIAEDEVICRLCIKIPPNGSYITLNKTSHEVSHCSNMIQMQLPEIDLTITDTPIICETCQKLLESYLSFATSCMDVEEKIKMYCEHQGSDLSEQVDLLCVLQFTENKAVDFENSFNGELVVKQEDNSVHVKEEQVEEVQMDNLPKDYFTDGNSTEFYIKKEEIEIKSEDDQTRMEMRESDQLVDSDSVGESGFPEKKISSKKYESEVNTNFCPKCSYTSKYNSGIKRHMRSHSHGKIWKCCLCPFTADNASSQKTHITSHRGPTNMFSCTVCPYKANIYRKLAHHVLKHKDESELEMFKCPLCPYKCKIKATLTQHRKLQHDENIKIYECKECSWSTKYKSNILRHQSLHEMVPSDKCQFRCDQCTYSTHNKHYMLRHKRNNHVASPKVMLQCNQCDFRTICRSSLYLHQNMHDPTKHKFKCEQCEYWSYHQSKLTRHLLTHIDLGKAVVYYCTVCDFKSKYKQSLRNHMKTCLKKKDKDDTDSRDRYQCNQCNFHTKNKRSLYSHKKIHDPTKDRFKCEQCEYSTYLQGRLSKHLLAHMGLGETVVYYCATCDFKSKYKNSLTYHVNRCSKRNETDDTKC